MAIVDNRVDEEKLHVLLKESESENLDFKASCNLSEKANKIELIKDIGAFQRNGGYVIIGVDDNGKLVGIQDEKEIELFDESRLRQMCEKYIPSPIELLSKIHTVEDKTIVLLCVKKRKSGLCFFKCDGQYQVEKSSGGKKDKCAFKKGDVYMRIGTSSEKLNQGGFEKFLSEKQSMIREEERTGMTKEMNEHLEELAQKMTNNNIIKIPISSIDWNIDLDTFFEAVLEAARNDDYLGLQFLLLKLEGEIGTLDPLSDDYLLISDRLCALGTVFLIADKEELFNAIIKILFSQFKTAILAQGGRPQLRQDVILPTIVRVMALGSFAVHMDRLAYIRNLVLQKDEKTMGEYSYNNWIRYAVTQAYRHKIMSQKGEIIELAANYLKERKVLCPGIGNPEKDNRLLNRLCQFDLLWNLIALDKNPDDKDACHWYPSFGRFSSSRITPILEKIINNESERKLYLNATPETLADLLSFLWAMTNREHRPHWDGSHELLVLNYIKKHKVPNQ